MKLLNGEQSKFNDLGKKFAIFCANQELMTLIKDEARNSCSIRCEVAEYKSTHEQTTRQRFSKYLSYADVTTLSTAMKTSLVPCGGVEADLSHL